MSYPMQKLDKNHATYWVAKLILKFIITHCKFCQYKKTSSSHLMRICTRVLRFCKDRNISLIQKYITLLRICSKMRLMWTSLKTCGLDVNLDFFWALLNLVIVSLTFELQKLIYHVQHGHVLQSISSNIKCLLMVVNKISSKIMLYLLPTVSV